MRRLIGVAGAVLLLVALAAPVSAAERVKEAGTFYQFTSGTFTCDANSCTDRFIDVFSIEPGLVAVCFGKFTFNARNGHPQVQIERLHGDRRLRPEHLRRLRGVGGEHRDPAVRLQPAAVPGR